MIVSQAFSEGDGILMHSIDLVTESKFKPRFAIARPSDENDIAILLFYAVNQINNTIKPEKIKRKEGRNSILEQIRILREAAGLTQAQLADRIGVVRTAVTLMEQPGRYPDASRMPAIAEALGCSIDALYGRDCPRKA